MSGGLSGLGLGEHRLSKQAQELAEARSAARGGTRAAVGNSVDSDCLASLGRGRGGFHARDVRNTGSPSNPGKELLMQLCNMFHACRDGS